MWILLFALTVRYCCASDLYSDVVLKYDSETFEMNVGRGKPHFINFFAPWCGYCKRLKPVWDELAEKHNENSGRQTVIIAKVDCTVDTPLCADQGVSGYPSLIFYDSKQKQGLKYKGKRDLIALEEFISLSTDENGASLPVPPVKTGNLDKIFTGALELTDDTFHSTIDWGLHFVKFYAPWCGHCQSLAPIWDNLAVNLKSDSSTTISKVDCTVNRIACDEFDVKAFPTLLWIVNGKKVEKYMGSRTLDDMKRFISDMKKNAKDIPENEDGKIPEDEMEGDSVVIHLTGNNFENAVGSGLSFVKFFAPWCGHCRRLAPTWDNLAKKFVANAHVKIAKVDCTLDDNLCVANKVQGYPTLLLFKDGVRMTEYNGLRDLDSLHSFVFEHLPHHDEL